MLLQIDPQKEEEKTIAFLKETFAKQNIIYIIYIL